MVVNSICISLFLSLLVLVLVVVSVALWCCADHKHLISVFFLTRAGLQITKMSISTTFHDMRNIYDFTILWTKLHDSKAV